MPDAFRGPLLKLQRANHHFIELERTEREFFENNPVDIVIEDEPKSGSKFVKIRLDTPAPEIIHILVGEIIYHLRSTLDQIAVAFARMSVAKPNPKNVYFPTGDCLWAFAHACNANLSDFDQDLRDQIISTEAYDGANDTLRAVFRMGNIDKHMELIPAGASGQLTGLSNFILANSRTGLTLGGPLRSLKDGIVICDLGPNGIFIPRNPEAEIHVTGRVTLGEASIYEGNPLIPFLRSLIDKTVEVSARLREHCVRTGRI